MKLQEYTNWNRLNLVVVLILQRTYVVNYMMGSLIFTFIVTHQMTVISIRQERFYIMSNKVQKKTSAYYTVMSIMYNGSLESRGQLFESWIVIVIFSSAVKMLKKL